MNDHREFRFGVRPSGKERVTGAEFRNNAVSSTKYTWWNFIVKCLLEQFRRFANLFFLLVGLLPLIKGVSNIRPEAAMAPITIVLTLSMIRELVEDLRRAATDRRINARDATVLVRSSTSTDSADATVMPWRDVAVGDVIHIHADEAVPADIVILQTALPSGLCYIETANLDGETNLKIHEAPRALPDRVATCDPVELTGALTCELPNNRLYLFEGSLKLDLHPEPIAVAHSNVVLRGCVLRNTPRVTGVVVYTGKDTKLVKNSVAPPSKRSTLEHAMDYAIGVIFLIDIIVCSVAALLAQLNPHHAHDYIHNGQPSIASSGTVGGGFFTFVSFMVLFNQMIPLSLYVSLEAAKIFQAMYMQEDLNMYHETTDTAAKANNSSLTEELGQIEMVMSDKTGTLTQNSMIFQCLAVKNRAYDLRLDADAGLRLSRATLDRDIGASSTLGDQLRQFWLSLALCHTVIVESDVAAAVEKLDGAPPVDPATLPVDGAASAAPATTKYQAESPDEAALVLAAKQRGFELRQRRINVVVVRVDGKDLEFDILAINEFDSTRKRMSVLVRFPDNSIFLIVKGADSVVESALANDSDEHPEDFEFDDIFEDMTGGKKATDDTSSVAASATAAADDDDDDDEDADDDPDDNTASSTTRPSETDEDTNNDGGGPPLRHTSAEEKAFVSEALSDFAREGLRTLLVAHRRFTPQQSARFMKAYRAASVAMTDRKSRMAQVADRVERRLTLIGATAIEDRLQDGVPDTISKLALAGIKLWVLTGDKVETAINIACSCNLIESNSDVIRVTGCKSAEEVSERLDHAYEQFIVPLDRGGLQAPRDGDDEVLVVNQSNGVSGGGDEKKDDAGDRELDNISPRSSSRRRRTRGDSRGAQLAHLVKDSILHVAGTGAPVEPIDAEQLAEEARGSLTLVVDGQSLEFITNDAVLSNNFLTIGRRCRSVVCCRVSPLQKSLVVKLVRLGLGARCLAVGDGANDVSMIQAAQVGVGISGNEGMQAVMASDFAIAQFRFLQDLLLVHGRNNYRRLCKLVLYSFYKNMAFVLVQFWYGADSAWSAENLYDAYAMALFNLAFTTLPLMCMGLFDRDVSRKSILQLPQLYESGRLSHDFGAIHLLLRLVAGIAASLILWYTMRAVGDEGVMRGDGKNTDQWVLGTMVYNVVILTATGAVMLDFRLWNVTHVCAIVISLAVWIIFLLAYGELRVPPENMYKLPLVMFEIPAFWLTSVLMPIGVLLPEFTLWYVQWQFFPRNDQIVAEVEQQGRELSDEELKRIARQYGDSAPVQVNAANYVRRGFERVFNRPDRTQSQYATATTLGDVDVLRRLNMFNPLVDPPKRRRRTLGSLLKKSKTKKEKQKQAKRQNSLTASTSTMTSSAGSTISSSDNK